MVKNFKGLVKVSDVQNEFDKLVQGLNTSVDEYNNIDELAEKLIFDIASQKASKSLH